MIIFEIRYYRLFACDPVRCRRDIVRYSSTCLELGIKKPMPSSESPPRAVLEPASRPTAQVVEGNPRLQRTSDRVYHAWDLKRNFCNRGNAKVDLYMSQMALADGMVGQKTVVWRTDDDDLAGVKFLDDGWDLSGQPWSRLSETEKAHARTFIGQGRPEGAGKLHEAVGGGGQSERVGEGQERAIWEQDRGNEDACVLGSLMIRRWLTALICLLNATSLSALVTIGHDLPVGKAMTTDYSLTTTSSGHRYRSKPMRSGSYLLHRI